MASKTKAQLLEENRQLREALASTECELQQTLKHLARRTEELIELNEELDECMDAVEGIHGRYFELREMRLGEALGGLN